MVSDCREDSYYFSVLERIKRKQNFYVCEHTHGRKKFREIYDAFVLLSGQYKEKFFVISLLYVSDSVMISECARHEWLRLKATKFNFVVFDSCSI